MDLESGPHGETKASEDGAQTVKLADGAAFERFCGFAGTAQVERRRPELFRGVPR